MEKQIRFLVTGGSGYFGGELKRSLLKDGHFCVNVDLNSDSDQSDNLISIQADLSDKAAVDSIFQKYAPFDCIFHAAAQLQCTKKNRNLFYATNVDATRYLAENCRKHQTSNFVYISSNCVYGKVNGIDIPEEYPLEPFETYGKTKVISEKILKDYSTDLNVIIFRPPTIIGEGRLGILSVVFDFIREHRKLWLVGNGENRYQFIYCNDLITACKLAANYDKSATFNIGCDDIPTLNQLFSGLITSAQSKSRIYHLPEKLMVPLMQLCFKLGISPLGPYQYNMMMNTFIGNTQKIKKELGWQPTKNNMQMLTNNYHFYINFYTEILNNKNLSGHRKMGRAGAIALLKWLS